MRDILGDMEKERTPQEFLDWVESTIAELDKYPCEEERFIKPKDSHKEAISKKFEEEILPAALFIKNYPEYLAMATLQYQKGNQHYEYVVKDHKNIKFIEITAPAFNKDSHDVDKELFEKGYAFRYKWGKRSDFAINTIKKALSNKVSNLYGKGYLLIIYIDDSGFSSLEVQEDFNKQCEEIVWDKGNFFDVFVVGKYNECFRKL